MINTTFVLKEPKSSSETIIYLVIRWDGLQMKISTKQKINPKFWNKERLKVKEVVSEDNHQLINKELVESEKVAYVMFKSFTETFKRFIFSCMLYRSTIFRPQQDKSIKYY